MSALKFPSLSNPNPSGLRSPQGRTPRQDPRGGNPGIIQTKHRSATGILPV